MIYKKYFIILFTMLFMGTFLVSCGDKTDTKENQGQVNPANVLKTIINVEGMTCEGCESAIQGNVAKMPGVVSVKASHTDKSTVVKYDKTQTSMQEIEKVISETGYKIFHEGEKEIKKEAPKAAMKCGEGKCGHAE